MRMIIVLLSLLLSTNGFTQTLKLAYKSNYQWTGVAISKENRIFVNFPRWTPETPTSVGEIINDKVVPFPNSLWNSWEQGDTSKNRFICVQSVFIDKVNRLWVLDTGYELLDNQTKGAVIYVFDLKTNRLDKKYPISTNIITNKAYLNDLRIDLKEQVAYISDSDVGGIVILDLKTETAKRVLKNHPSTLAEVSQINIEGKIRENPVHSDGIALSPDRKYLYYAALTGKNVYKIPTNILLNNKLDDAAMGAAVEMVATTGANDGILFDKKGNLYLSSLEANAVKIINKRGEVVTVVQDDRIKWPDSFAMDNKGVVYFTTSKIHLPREERNGYEIFKIIPEN